MEGIQDKDHNWPQYRWKAFNAKTTMSPKLEGIQGKVNNGPQYRWKAFKAKTTIGLNIDGRYSRQSQ